MESTKELNGLGSWSKKLLSLFKKHQVQKTYIVPTKFGLAYGAVCLALLLMAMAYGNNVVYIVCFYVTVMGMGVARWTNENVNSVNIESCFAQEVFASTAHKLSVQVRNTGKNHQQGLVLQFDKKVPGVHFDLKPQETRIVEIPWRASQRGYTKLPSLRLSSQYPGGLFEAWKVKRQDEKIVVYPELKGQRNFPESAFSSTESLGVLREIRDYKAGDSPKRIHWRSLAKNQQLRTLVHESNEGRTCYLKWSQVAQLPLEEALSQLTLWLHQAHTSGNPWSLELLDAEFNSNHGTQAYHKALEKMALWGELT